jgi:hypothetical protein
MTNYAFMSAWLDRLAALPSLRRLSVAIEPNVDRESLSCLVCNRGESGEPTEWIALVRSGGQSIAAGLHEVCRHRTQERSEKSQ